MERFIQHEILFIRHFKTNKWPYPVHNHNYFELVFIHSGSGYHDLNGDRQPYAGKCLFLLAPSDYHIFEIQEETDFSVLKFNNGYLDGASSTSKNEWNKLIDHLLAISAVQDSCLVKSTTELDKIDQLMKLIVEEWKESLNATNEVIFCLIRSVFAIIKKNALNTQLIGSSLNGSLFLSMMDFIHINIHYPERLSLKALSDQFNFSSGHLNSLFRDQMGIPIKKYIGEYKFKLIENRLKFSDLMIKEISVEFGFSDLSHFNKFLKKHSGLNPKAVKGKA